MKAKFNEDNELVLNKKRYKDFYSKKYKISKYQFGDGILIQLNPNVALYEPEYRDYIEDYRYRKEKYKRKEVYYTNQVFWDHVVVTTHGNVVIFESDDPSHRDYNYCLTHGYVECYQDFEDIKDRDFVKDEWCRINNIRLIRINSDLSYTERKKLIDNALEDY